MQCNYSCTTASHLQRQICRYIQGINLSIAYSATSHAQTLVTSRHTCSPIQEKSLSVAHFVPTPSKKKASNLKTHMLIHSGEKHFRCEQYNYSCIQAGDLKKHKLQHTREKPLSCKQCSCTFRRPNDLKYHMLLHTGEKPFACKQCNYYCKQSNQLKIHMKKRSAKTNI